MLVTVLIWEVNPKCSLSRRDGGNDNSVDVEREDIDCDGPSGQNPEGSILGKFILRSFPEITQNEQIKSDGGIPDVTDFIFAYATPSGYLAYRDLKHGSWYISELCKALCTYSSVLSLEAIMTKVRCKVGVDYSHSYFKQAPETKTRLRAQVFFWHFWVLNECRTDVGIDYMLYILYWKLVRVCT